jgi:hypothetical protein
MSKSAHTRFLVQGKSDVPDVKQAFIAEDDEVEERYTKGDESEDDDADLFDSVCSICDNGGDLLWYINVAS